MSGMRQKIQYSLALVPEGRGEAPDRGHQGTEPPVAKPAPERPACAEQMMEEVCDRGNLVRAWKRVRSNRGGPGVDGMTIEGAKAYLRWVAARAFRGALAAPSHRGNFPAGRGRARLHAAARTAGRGLLERRSRVDILASARISDAACRRASWATGSGTSRISAERTRGRAPTATSRNCRRTRIRAIWLVSCACATRRRAAACHD